MPPAGQDVENKSYNKPAAPVAEDTVNRLPERGAPHVSPASEKPMEAGKTAENISLDGVGSPEASDHVQPTTSSPGSYPGAPGEQQTKGRKIGDKWVFHDGQSDLAPDGAVESATKTGTPRDKTMSAQLIATPLVPRIAARGLTLPTDYRSRTQESPIGSE